MFFYVVVIRVNYSPLPSKVFELHSLSPLIQNILENIALPSPKRRLNYISLSSYVKIYTLLLQ